MRSIRPVTMNRLLVAGACLLAGALSASAHHSVTGVFDAAQTISVTGTIVKLEWVNPHSYLYVDVQKPGEAVTHYAFETLPPSMMRRAGVNRDMLLGGSEVGQVVTVRANPGRANPHEGWITRITYADGHFYQLSPDARKE
jgi:hypothetical protein